jgi:acetyltransferase-like isoleucine patch superfamily enzyme
MKDIIAAIRGALFTFWCNKFRKNIHIGSNLRIYKKVSVTGSGKLAIGNDCVIKGIMGDCSQYTCIDMCNSDAVIIIGNKVSLHAARITAKFDIIIGDQVTIDEATVYNTDFHSIDKHRNDADHEEQAKCKIKIGDRVHIGARSAIMKGVSIADDVTVLPGSIVVNTVKERSVVCGNPAKPLP